ncbi:MAG: hypothetical protein AAFP90_13535 [Planctomycetota bacterium]
MGDGTNCLGNAAENLAIREPKHNCGVSYPRADGFFANFPEYQPGDVKSLWFGIGGIGTLLVETTSTM